MHLCSFLTLTVISLCILSLQYHITHWISYNVFLTSFSSMSIKSALVGITLLCQLYFPWAAMKFIFHVPQCLSHLFLSSFSYLLPSAMYFKSLFLSLLLITLHIICDIKHFFFTIFTPTQWRSWQLQQQTHSTLTCP